MTAVTAASQGPVVLPAGMVMTPARVEQVEPVAGGFFRVTLGAEAFSQLGPGGLAPAFKLFLPRPGRDRVVLPAFDENRLPVWPSADDVPVVRSYTARGFRTGDTRLAFDVLDLGHEDSWPRRLDTGSTIGWIGFKHGLVLADEIRRLVAVGDASAQPALHELADRAPAGIPVQVSAWDPAPGAGFPAAVVEELGRGTVADGQTQFWLGGEVARVGRLRSALFDAGVAASRVHALAYWADGLTRDQFDRVLMARYQAAARDGLDISDPVVAASIEFG